jgi:hypothetical protein
MMASFTSMQFQTWVQVGCHFPLFAVSLVVSLVGLLAAELKQMSKELGGVSRLTSEEIHQWIAQQHCVVLRATLWLFLVCHAVVVLDDCSRFNLNYLRAFQLLTTAKTHLFPLLGINATPRMPAQIQEGNQQFCTCLQINLSGNLLPRSFVKPWPECACASVRILRR